MADRSEVGRLVRAARVDHDLTLEALAAATGLTDRSISDIERGVTIAPRAHTLRRIADALDLEPESRERLLAAGRRARSDGAEDADRSLLPHRVRDFVGRESELSHLRSLLAAADGAPAVAVVIAGAPGNGKTTLAAEFLYRHASPSQRLYADLRGLEADPPSAASVLRGLLVQLPDAPAPAASLAALAAQWRDATAGRTLHVLLDNAASEAQVRPVLALEAAGSVIVTSRRSLAGLEGARHLPLDPLPIADSVRLLTSLMPQSALADDLAELAKLCDRIPLALRIAGSRLASNPTWRTEDFVAQLRAEDRRLQVLVAGDLAVERAFELSYDHTSVTERRLFEALSLIDDVTWPHELPAAILQVSAETVHEGLDELIELGLVQQTAPTRYRLHDLLRLFSRSRLEHALPADQVGALEQRKIDWLLSCTRIAGGWFEPGQAAEPGPIGLSSADEARDWLQEEVGSWLPALRLAAASGDDRAVLETADSLHWFSDIWLHAGIWHEVFGLSAAAAERHGDHREMAVHLGYLSWATGMEFGDFTTASEQARRALEHAEVTGDPLLSAWSAYYLGEALIRIERLDEALEASTRAVDLFEVASSKEGVPQGLATLAMVLIRLGRLDEAASACVRILRLVTDAETAPPFTVARFTEMSTYDKLARIRIRQGRPAEALEAAVGCARAADTIDHGWGRVRVIEIEGEVALLEGDVASATDLLRSAHERYTALGWARGITSSRELLAGIGVVLGG